VLRLSLAGGLPRCMVSPPSDDPDDDPPGPDEATWLVEVRDDIAVLQSKAFDGALEVLRGVPGVRRVAREDRERALVWAPEVTAETLQAVMDDALPADQESGG